MYLVNCIVETSGMGKFALDVKDGEQDEVPLPLELNSEVDINLGDLINPKLLP